MPIWRYGGWIRRYDLKPSGLAETTVRLTYDWSAMPHQIREHFDMAHLDNSLRNLAVLARPRE